MPRLPRSRTRRRLAAASIAAVLLAAALPTAAFAQGELSGTVPERGIGLAIWSGGPVAEVQPAAASHGCPLVSVWANRSGGGLVGHISGAPSFVNTAFAEVYPADLAPSTPVVVVCGTSSAPPPPQQPGTTPPPPTQGGVNYFPIPDGYPGPAANQ